MLTLSHHPSPSLKRQLDKALMNKKKRGLSGSAYEEPLIFLFDDFRDEEVINLNPFPIVVT